MAKEKKEAAVVETNKVALEMTKEEAQEFAAFKLKKEQDDKEQAEKTAAKELWMVNLTYKHRVNGVNYGPGATQVPKELVGHFEHYERKQLENELKLNQSTKNFFNVLGQGRAVRVKDLPG